MDTSSWTRLPLFNMFDALCTTGLRMNLFYRYTLYLHQLLSFFFVHFKSQLAGFVAVVSLSGRPRVVEVNLGKLLQVENISLLAIYSVSSSWR